MKYGRNLLSEWETEGGRSCFISAHFKPVPVKCHDCIISFLCHTGVLRVESDAQYNAV